MKRVSSLFLALFAASAQAIVIRSDVADAEYRVDEKELAALVDLDHEGHGVLIAPQWVLTAAHATTWHPQTAVMLDGECRDVEKVVVHPGYKPLPDELAKGDDAAAVMAALSGSDDIALIKLKEPMTGIEPVAIYRAQDETGRRVKLVGKGATGTGETGHGPDAPHRTELRRAFNRIDGADGRWLNFDFDRNGADDPLEGVTGDGDSGGPVLIEDGGEWKVAGINSFKHVDGALADFRPGTYGSRLYQVRVSHYAEWIDSVMAGDAP